MPIANDTPEEAEFVAQSDGNGMVPGAPMRIEGNLDPWSVLELPFQTDWDVELSLRGDSSRQALKMSMRNIPAGALIIFTAGEPEGKPFLKILKKSTRGTPEALPSRDIVTT